MPTVASCNFDKHGLILIIFGEQHQHTFRYDVLIQLSLALHFYLIYVLFRLDALALSVIATARGWVAGWVAGWVCHSRYCIKTTKPI